MTCLDQVQYKNVKGTLDPRAMPTFSAHVKSFGAAILVTNVRVIENMFLANVLLHPSDETLES